MRNVSVYEISKNIKEMCIEANHFLTDDMKEALSQNCNVVGTPQMSQIGIILYY